MDKLEEVIHKFNLDVLSINEVPESFSSSVYKLQLTNRQTVYVKIPYSKTKLQYV